MTRLFLPLAVLDYPVTLGCLEVLEVPEWRRPLRVVLSLLMVWECSSARQDFLRLVALFDSEFLLLLRAWILLIPRRNSTRHPPRYLLLSLADAVQGVDGEARLL